MRALERAFSGVVTQEVAKEPASGDLLRRVLICSRYEYALGEGIINICERTEEAYFISLYTLKNADGSRDRRM